MLIAPRRFKVPVFEMLQFTDLCVACKSAQKYTVLIVPKRFKVPVFEMLRFTDF